MADKYILAILVLLVHLAFFVGEWKEPPEGEGAGELHLLLGNLAGGHHGGARFRRDDATDHEDEPLRKLLDIREMDDRLASR